MAKIIKFKDWIVKNPHSYKQIKQDELGENIYNHEWSPGDVQQVGTVHDETSMNNLSKAGTYFVNATRISTNPDIYKLVDFEGIEEFDVFEGLKLKVKINESNTSVAYLNIDNVNYPIIRYRINGYENIIKGDLRKENVYDMMYHGGSFITNALNIYDNVNGISGFPLIQSDGVLEAGKAIDFKHLGHDVDFNSRIELDKESGDLYLIRNEGNGVLIAKKLLAGYFDGASDVEGAAFVKADGVAELGWAIDLRHKNWNLDFNVRLELDQNNGDLLMTQNHGNGKITTDRILDSGEIINGYLGGMGKIASAEDVKVLKESIVKYDGINNKQGFAYISSDGILEVGNAIDFKHLGHEVDFNSRIELGGSDGELYLTKQVSPNVFEISKIITRNNYRVSFGTSGYEISPTGLITVWARLSDGVPNVTFPFTFPNAIQSLVVSRTGGNVANTIGSAGIGAPTTANESRSGFTVDSVVGSADKTELYYIAIGY